MARTITKEINNKKERAESYFSIGDYSNAHALYAELFAKDQNDLESKLGLLLSDMATEREGEAQALYDYYRILKTEEVDTPEQNVIDMLKNLDSGHEFVISLVTNAMQSRYHAYDGIAYGDFREIVEQKGDFKEAFEDLMFSTRVIISEVDEFVEFVGDLIDNGYNDIAMSYLEGLGRGFVVDERVRDLYLKIAGRNEGIL